MFKLHLEPWCRQSACVLAMVFAGLLVQGCAEADSSAAAVTGGQNAGQETPSAKATQVAARVNAEELTVHQLNERLAAWTGAAGISGAEDPTVGRSLNRLIELTLLRQEAEAQGLASKPEVMRQLLAARSEVLARAMAQQLGDEGPSPAPQEVRRYFDEHPEAFSRRQVFLVQEVRSAAEGTALDKALPRLNEFRNAQAFARALEREGARAEVVHLQVSSDQLPLKHVARLKGLPPEQPIRMDEGQVLRVWWVQASVDQPIEWERAQGVIERLLSSQMRAERVRREIDRLRNQGSVEYVGDFARWSPPTASKTSTSGESAQAGGTSAAAR